MYRRALVAAILVAAPLFAVPPTPTAAPPRIEVVVEDSKHRVLLVDPDAALLERLAAAGVVGLVDFRPDGEAKEIDRTARAAAAGLRRVHLPYANAGELTDAIVDAARAALRDADAKGEALVLHCRTGNRVGPAWIAYRTLDRGVPLAQAVAEARSMGLVVPLLEARARDYVRRHDATVRAWTPLELETLDPAARAAYERAQDARDAMFGRLLEALGSAMGEPDGSPARAIAVCRELAPTIARSTSREHDLLIGRTSARLRNPASLPPPWAPPLAGDAPAEPRAFGHPDGSHAFLFPIRTLPTCLVCHGPLETIAPEVRAALVETYPEDRALGFAEGDLRGWFWIEAYPRTK